MNHRRMAVLAVIVIVVVAAIGTVLSVSYPPEEERRMSFIDQRGSETMYELGLGWAAAYEADHDLVQVNVSRGGSGPGIAALLQDQADIAQVSRQIKTEEMALAESKGMEIIELRVALDGIAMLVNPYLYVRGITDLSVGQLCALYNGSVSNWLELGGPDAPVLIYGRNNTSGTYSFFQDHVLEGQEYGSTLVEYDNYDVMIADLQNPANRGAIGYVGVGYVNNYPDVHILSLSSEEGGPSYQPTRDHVESFEYPLARYLYLYLNHQPAGELLEYLEWILAEDQGQAVVVQKGFYPIPQEVREENLSRLL